MFFEKPKKDPFWKPEYEELARYNEEVCRGLIHSSEHKAKMARLQSEYNKRQREFAKTELMR